MKEDLSEVAISGFGNLYDFKFCIEPEIKRLPEYKGFIRTNGEQIKRGDLPVPNPWPVFSWLYWLYESTDRLNIDITHIERVLGEFKGTFNKGLASKIRNIVRGFDADVSLKEDSGQMVTPRCLWNFSYACIAVMRPAFPIVEKVPSKGGSLSKRLWRECNWTTNSPNRKTTKKLVDLVHADGLENRHEFSEAASQRMALKVRMIARSFNDDVTQSIRYAALEGYDTSNDEIIGEIIDAEARRYLGDRGESDTWDVFVSEMQNVESQIAPFLPNSTKIDSILDTEPRGGTEYEISKRNIDRVSTNSVN